MTTVDFGLIPSLAALLDEASVSRAAARVGVTIPTMSRTLARLRKRYADPLLVRAGRQLVLTEFAKSLRPLLTELATRAEEVLCHAGQRPTLPRTLLIRANDGMVGPWLEPLLTSLRHAAPGVRLGFVAEGAESPDELRDGRADLDIGALGESAPELLTQVLRHDCFAMVVGRRHPLTRGKPSAARLCAFEHIGVSRKARFDGPVDAALERLGLARRVVATIPSASAAAIAVSRSDLITAMPLVVARAFARLLPLSVLPMPLELPAIVISQTWHPRSDADPAHRLLRQSLRDLFNMRSTGRGSSGSRDLEIRSLA